jgi:hypothetical protein
MDRPPDLLGEVGGAEPQKLVEGRDNPLYSADSASPQPHLERNPLPGFTVASMRPTWGLRRNERGRWDLYEDFDPELVAALPVAGRA